MKSNMNKSIKKLLVFALVFVSALNQVTAQAALAKLSNTQLSVAKDSKGTLFWKMTLKQFKSTYNALAEEVSPDVVYTLNQDWLEADKSGANSDALDTDNTIYFYVNSSKNIKKIVYTYEIEMVGDEPDPSAQTTFSTVAPLLVMTMCQHDEKNFDRIMEIFDLDASATEKDGVISKSVAIKTVRYTFSVKVQKSGKPLFTFTMAPQVKK